MNLIRQFIAALVDGVGEMSRLRQSIDKHTGAIRDASERQDHRQPPPNVRAEISFTEDAQTATNTNNERQYRIQKSLRDWTRAAFFAAAVYAGIAAYQLRQMKRAADETGKAANAAVTQLGIAQQAIDITVKQFRLDQRAWIFADNPVGTPEPNHPFIVYAVLKNTGKTPAENVVIDIGGRSLNTIPNVRQKCHSNKMNTGSKDTIVPNSMFTSPVNISRAPLPSDWASRLAPGQKIYLYGCLLYDDVFADPHWLTFCSQWVDDGQTRGFVPCNQYNDTGDGKPPE